MFKTLSLQEKRDLWDAVSEFITEERKAHYDRILQYRTRHFTIALEDIFQEHNAGALTRTAECYGIQDVHVMKNHNEFKIAKGMAKGARNWIDIHTYDGQESVLDCMHDLRKKGYRIVATSPHKKANPLENFDIKVKSAFFFGTEKNGLDPRIMEGADSFLYVPIYGVTESFNVSVTAAVIMHELTKKLHQEEFEWRLSPEEQLHKRLEWAYGSIRKARILYDDKLRAINPKKDWRD